MHNRRKVYTSQLPSPIVTTEMRLAVNKAAHAQGISISEVMRRALAAYLEAHNFAFQEAVK